MNVLKKYAWYVAAVIASFAVAVALLLTWTPTPVQAAGTNVAVMAMADQQAVMTVANPDQIPRLEIAQAISATGGASVLGAVMAIGILAAAVVALLVTNYSAIRVGFGFQVMREQYGTWRGNLGSLLPSLRPSASLFSGTSVKFTSSAGVLTAATAALVFLGLVGSAGFTQLRL